jgi:hypothetical protein
MKTEKKVYPGDLTAAEAQATFDKPGVLVPAAGMNQVAQTTLDQFLAAFVGKVEVVAKKGRCIEVKFPRGLQMTKLDIVDALLGNGNPCDEFNMRDGKMYARLKIIPQLWMDIAARAIDEQRDTPEAPNPMLGEFGPNRSSDTFHFFEPIFDKAAQPAPALSRGETQKKGNAKKLPEGVAVPHIMRTMEMDAPNGTIDLERLIAKTKEKMAPMPDSRGDDRRRKNIKDGIDKLLSREFLFAHGEEQTDISLSRLVVEEVGEAD